MLPRLHVVTDDAVLAGDGFLEKAESVLAAGETRVAFHLRGHGTTARRLLELARALMPHASRAGALLLVNDRIDIAVAVGAGGVQLGQRSVRPAQARKLVGNRSIGVSVHSTAEAAAAAADGADFLLLGTIFATPSHTGVQPAGTDLIQRCRRTVDRPILAIGGITVERTPEILQFGAHGVAVLRSVWSAPAPDQAVRQYLEALVPAAV